MENVKKTEPRGIRNNNPLNIRYVWRNKWVGRRSPKTDKHFEEFEAMKYGWRAGFILMYKYIHVHKCTTLRKLIERWAPRSENNTETYIKTVEYRGCMNADDELDFSNSAQMLNIASEMAFVETGKGFDLREVAWGYCLACASLGIDYYTSGGIYEMAIFHAQRMQELQDKEREEDV